MAASTLDTQKDFAAWRKSLLAYADRWFESCYCGQPRVTFFKTCKGKPGYRLVDQIIPHEEAVKAFVDLFAIQRRSQKTLAAAFLKALFLLWKLHKKLIDRLSTADTILFARQIVRYETNVLHYCNRDISLRRRYAVIKGLSKKGIPPELIQDILEWAGVRAR